MSRELELMKQVVREWEEMLSDGSEGGPCGDNPTFLEALQEFRENLVELDLVDAGDDPTELNGAERDIAIVNSWLGILAGDTMYTVHDLPHGVRVLIPHP